MTQNKKTTTFDNDVAFVPLFDETENVSTHILFLKNAGTLSNYLFTADIKSESNLFYFDDYEKSSILQSSVYNTRALLEKDSEEEDSQIQEHNLALLASRGRIADINDPIDEDLSDIMRSRAVEQEVLDILDEPVSR